jgi:hypothetical protein
LKQPPGKTLGIFASITDKNIVHYVAIYERLDSRRYRRRLRKQSAEQPNFVDKMDGAVRARNGRRPEATLGSEYQKTKT